jgi:FkbH-like protein
MNKGFLVLFCKKEPLASLRVRDAALGVFSRRGYQPRAMHPTGPILEGSMIRFLRSLFSSSRSKAAGERPREADGLSATREMGARAGRATGAADAFEPVRLVIWDLDETFWQGTVTEGGMVWREAAEHAVRTLATRGIISAICSKNDPAVVEPILAQHGVAEYFVFNSISWDAKGPRLAELIRRIQLRPESVLFIDDNPANLAEASHFVPGLQVADHTIIGALLDDPRCAGKLDLNLMRLAQYRVLERRQRDEAAIGGDAAEFLRESGIKVTIEYDVAAHIDRAVELINRTNQLNFTKSRLPEDTAAARAQLRALLSEHTIQAGLLHVRDNYGDYGFCGIYVMRSQRARNPFLLHFAFSCRILGMGVETWLWRRLGKPALTVAPPVLTDIANDTREIDWIGTELAGVDAPAGDAPRQRFAYVLARGGCDMRAVAHYFGAFTDRVYEEFDTIRQGQTPMVNHSLIALQAMRGIDDSAVADFAPFGFLPEDFTTLLAASLPGPAIWLLSFTIEADTPLFSHRATGALLPASVVGMPRDRAAFMAGREAGEVDAAVAAHLRDKFEYTGIMPEALFRTALRAVFGRAGADVRVFVLLGNTRMKTEGGGERVVGHMQAHNAIIADEAKAFGNVETVAPADFMSAAEIQALKTFSHFDRMVYFRIFRHIMSRMTEGSAAF